MTDGDSMEYSKSRMECSNLSIIQMIHGMNGIGFSTIVQIVAENYQKKGNGIMKILLKYVDTKWFVDSLAKCFYKRGEK